MKLFTRAGQNNKQELMKQKYIQPDEEVHGCCTKFKQNPLQQNISPLFIQAYFLSSNLPI